MEPAVRDVLWRIVSRSTDGTDAGAAEWLDTMKQAGRYNRSVFNA